MVVKHEDQVTLSESDISGDFTCSCIVWLFAFFLFYKNIKTNKSSFVRVFKFFTAASRLRVVPTDEVIWKTEPMFLNSIIRASVLAC